MSDPSADDDARVGLRDRMQGAAEDDPIEAAGWRASVAERLFGRTREPPTIGRYRITARIGAGTSGIVYAAVDPELDRAVAIKLLHAGGDAERSLREAKLLARLSDPNVVPIHDVGVHEGRVFVTLELVRGRSGRQWLADDHRLDEVVGVFVQIGRGLAAAHRAGIVHRDVKPENVLIGDDGRVRVSDFGIARLGAGRGADDAEAAIDVSGGAGTPAYMAPEQFLGEAVDARSDQFSYCVMLHEAICGERPFAGADRAALAAAVVAGRRRPPPPGRTIPARIERVLARGLAIDPRRRFADMDALVQALVGSARATLVGVALAGVGIGALALAIGSSDDSDGCGEADRALAAAWTPADADGIRTAFAASSTTHARADAERVIGEIDRYAGAWRDAHAQACETTSDETTRIARRYCLHSRVLELDALVDVFTEADAEVITHAATSATSLRNPQDCLWVAAEVPAAEPGDPQGLAELRRTIARAAALGEGGRLREGLQLARAASVRARDLGDHGLEAEALLATATLERGLLGVERDFDPAVTVHAAELAAAAAHRADLAALAAVMTLETAVDRGEHERARMLEPRARELLASLGDPPELSGRIALALARARALEGRTELVEAELARARAAFERSGPASARFLGASLNLEAEAAFDRGDVARAREIYTRARELLRESFGEHHVVYAAVVGNLAETYFVEGDFVRARELFGQALAIRREVFGDASVWAIHGFAHLGDVALELGDPETALATYRQALALRMALRPGRERPDAAEPIAIAFRDLQTAMQEAWLRHGIAAALVDLGRADEALRELAELPDDALPDDRHHPDLTARIDMHGRVLLALGRPQEAADALVLAVARLRARYLPGTRVLAFALAALGRAQLEIGRADDAEPNLREALEILTQGYPRTRAELSLDLARARLAQGDREAALRSAAQARAAVDDAQLSATEIADRLRAEITTTVEAARRR